MAIGGSGHSASFNYFHVSLNPSYLKLRIAIFILGSSWDTRTARHARSEEAQDRQPGWRPWLVVPSRASPGASPQPTFFLQRWSQLVHTTSRPRLNPARRRRSAEGPHQGPHLPDPEVRMQRLRSKSPFICLPPDLQLARVQGRTVYRATNSGQDPGRRRVLSEDVHRPGHLVHCRRRGGRFVIYLCRLWNAL